MPLTPTRKLKRGVTVGNSLALVTDSSGRAATGATTATEIGYVAGVTSAVQTQLDARLALAGGTMTGQINFSGTTHAGLKLISLTTAQRDALTPANGMMIYNTTNARVEQYTGGAWAAVSSSSFELYDENPSSPTAPNASGANSVCIGSGSVASGVGAINIYSGGVGGATGDGAMAVLGGTASGVRSFAASPNAVASASDSFAFGYGAKASVAGKFAFTSHLISNSGDSQCGLLVLGADTTNATQTEITNLRGAVGSVGCTLPNTSTFAFSMLVVARRTDADGENDAWEFKGLIHRDANAASTTLDALQSNQIGATAWSVDVDADTANGSLRVRVTGEAAKTIRWVATINTTEVSE